MIDFNIDGKMPSCYTEDLNPKEIEVVKTLLESSSHSLLGSYCELKSYELLVMLEKEISLEVIYMIKNNTFTTYNFPKENIFLKPLPKSFSLSPAISSQTKDLVKG